MAFAVAFHHKLELLYRGAWSQLQDTFALPHVYEIGAPDHFETDAWTPLASEGDLPGTVVLFSPQSAAAAPGTIALPDFNHGEVIYYFGHDDQDQQPLAGAQAVYIPVPADQHHLWAYQAASIVLYDRWVRHGNP